MIKIYPICPTSILYGLAKSIYFRVYAVKGNLGWMICYYLLCLKSFVINLLKSFDIFQIRHSRFKFLLSQLTKLIKN